MLSLFLLVTTRQRPSRVATQYGIASVRRRKSEGRTKRERLVSHLDTTWENRTLPVTKRSDSECCRFFLLATLQTRRAHNGTPSRRAEQFCSALALRRGTTRRLGRLVCALLRFRERPRTIEVQRTTSSPQNHRKSLAQYCMVPLI